MKSAPIHSAGSRSNGGAGKRKAAAHAPSRHCTNAAAKTRLMWFRDVSVRLPSPDLPSSPALPACPPLSPVLGSVRGLLLPLALPLAPTAPAAAKPICHSRMSRAEGAFNVHLRPVRGRWKGGVDGDGLRAGSRVSASQGAVRLLFADCVGVW